ncbi:MAG TPA: peptidylprolyl isomerase [Burkholderiaceae bacterium]|nr:peptidylprolyl isomerase [Burkholderiaceae bacterium]
MKRIAVVAAACLIAAPVSAQTVATVNGQEISQQNLDGFVSLLVSQGATDSEELREQVKQEMIHRLVAVQAAEKAGIDKKDDVRQEIELARQGILVRALMADYLEKNPVTDAQVQSTYDELKDEQSKRLEYRVRHILVDDEKVAQDLIDDISSDKVSFEDAARQESKDPGSGANGGDLGWAAPANYVPEFAEAVEALGKGEMTDKPVQSQFGWHIIRVEDTRSASFPPLESVKPQIEEMLRQQQLASFQDELVKNATIKE